MGFSRSYIKKINAESPKRLVPMRLLQEALQALERSRRRVVDISAERNQLARELARLRDDG